MENPSDRRAHEPGFHLSCDEHLSEGWGPPLFQLVTRIAWQPSPRTCAYET